MRHNKLFEIYRQLVNRSSTDAPDDVWHSISQKLDAADAIAGAADSTSRADKELLNSAWAGIADEMDMDEVWDKIAHELDRKPLVATLFPRYLYRGIAAAVLLLLSVGGLIYFLSSPYMGDNQPVALVDTTLTKEKAQQSANLDETASLKKHLSEDSDNTHAIDSLRQADITTEGHDPALLAASLNSKRMIGADDSTGLSISPVDPEGEGPGSLKYIPDVLTRPLPRMPASLMADGKTFSEPHLIPLSHQLDYDLDVPALLKKPEPETFDLLAFNRRDSRWSVGIVSAIKNTYLLNRKTIEGFKADNMNESKIAFLPDLGVNVKYAFNQKLLMDMNVFFSSASRQNYNEYLFGKYESTHIQLNYLLAEFSLKHNSSRSFLSSEKIIRRNVAGIYLGSLQDARETVGSGTQNVTAQYAPLDYGVLAGQEFEIKTRTPLKFTAGITAKYGLANAFKGSERTPAYLHRTHNASIEFRVGLAWRFKSGSPADYYLGSLIK